MMQLSPGRLLVLVTVAGLGYSGWTNSHEHKTRTARAGACRANLNLIDRYVALWERRHEELSAKAGMLSMELAVDGTIARASGLPPELRSGSDVLAQVARDPEAFVCPEGGMPSLARPSAVHYRWVMSEDPLSALDGGTRGAVCALHGDERSPDDRAGWHALVRGRSP